MTRDYAAFYEPCAPAGAGAPRHAATPHGIAAAGLPDDDSVVIAGVAAPASEMTEATEEVDAAGQRSQRVDVGDAVEESMEAEGSEAAVRVSDGDDAAFVGELAAVADEDVGANDTNNPNGTDDDRGDRQETAQGEVSGDSAALDDEPASE